MAMGDNIMATAGVMIASAILNATAFIGGSQIAKICYPTDKNVEEERIRHDLAQEKFTKDHNLWSENRSNMYDFKQKQKLVQNVAQTDFQITDENLQLYKEYHPDGIDTEPIFDTYYQPSDEMKKYQYLYIIGGMGLSVYLLKRF